MIVSLVTSNQCSMQLLEVKLSEGCTAFAIVATHEVPAGVELVDDFGFPPKHVVLLCTPSYVSIHQVNDENMICRFTTGF